LRSIIKRMKIILLVISILCNAGNFFFVALLTFSYTKYIKVIKPSKMTPKYASYKKGTSVKEVVFSVTIALIYFFTFFFLISYNGLAQETSSLKKEIVLSKDTSKSGVQDARPLISADGRHLFFGRRNNSKNVGGKTDPQDIWVATLDTLGKFSRISSLGKTINTVNGNGICSVNPDGNEIIITNDYFGNKTTPIAKSKKTNGIWSNPQPVYIEDYYNKSPYVDFFISYQSKTLFFAADRKGGLGDQDLFICLEGENGNWKKPIHLGAIINSKGAEYAPYLSADGKTLFFASTRNGGLGGSDIYASTRLDESWTNWSEPKNLGPVVNTEGDENYFSITADLKTILVESLAKDKVKRSIYKIEVTESNKLASDYLLSAK
jgi:hypothetical protein